MMVRPPLGGRFGLPAVTAIMGAMLVATAVAGYLGARDAAAALVQARSFDLALSLRRELHGPGSLDADRLAAVLADVAEQGVTFVAILGPREDGRDGVLASAGTALGSLDVRGASASWPRLPWRWVEGRVQVLADLPPGGRGPMMMMGPGRGGPRHGARRLVFEFEPAAASGVVRRSAVTLAVSVAAAALLLAAAVLAWRQALQNERLGAELARDQQLKSLGQMSAVLSHELRNPLASLKGHAQLLVEKLDAGHAGRAGAERIVAEAWRLEAIANQILEFARPGALERRDESVEAVVRAAIAAVDDPRVRLAVAEGVATFSLHRLRMEQLLVNLIRNATEASPPDGMVEVSAERADGNLVLSVRDHGPGLPPGEEARVFEPFFARRVRGTGLGLAIAKQTAEAHGGRLEGSTHPDGGALFRVVVPPVTP